MKTKLLYLLTVIFILSMIVTSCGEVSTTVQTTVPQNSNCSWGMYTTYDTLEEFLYDINNPYDNDKNEQLQQSDAKMFEHFKDRGKVHYVEVKFDEYMIGGVWPGSYSIRYWMFPKKTFTGDYLDFDLAVDDLVFLQIEYRNDLQILVSQFENTVELDNGSFYCEKRRQIFFEYDGFVGMLTLPKNYKGSLDWRDILDVKYVELSK